MIWLHMTVEGQTEWAFVNAVIAPHLKDGFHVLADVRMVSTCRRKGKRGGMTSYQRVKNDILRWMAACHPPQGYFFTTMFDLYALPTDFPEFGAARRASDPLERVRMLEDGLCNDFRSRWDPTAPPLQLIPYVQLHEFEALLFADPQQFDWGVHQRWACN
jgi:hypothetical protein